MIAKLEGGRELIFSNNELRLNYCIIGKMRGMKELGSIYYGNSADQWKAERTRKLHMVNGLVLKVCRARGVEVAKTTTQE